MDLTLYILTAIFQDDPELAGFIGAKDNGSVGDNWSYKTCKVHVKLPPPINQHQFVQAVCPSCRSTYSVEALKGNKMDLTVFDYQLTI